jgi:hypothetical protein
MEIESQNSKQDYINFYKAYLRDYLKKKRIVLVIIFLVFVAFLNSNGFSWTNLLISMLLSALLIAAAYYFIPLLIRIVLLNRLIAKESGYLERRKYIITDDGLISKDSSTETKRNWESIPFASINDAGVYIKLIDRKFLLIGKNNFQSDADALNFLGLLQQHISKANSYQNFLIKGSKQGFDQGKPPYSLGWLGLVPLLGGLVGVVLVLYGLLKYKDRKLVMIGLAGVIFTVAVYGSLFYMTKFDFIKDEFAKADTMVLNSLIKDIEFYKIQNGNYPDRLEQLNTNGTIVNYYDPLLSDPENNKFNYYRSGKHYTVFSSGIDEKPNTADDIYPTIKIDTNKIGLIIRANRKTRP